MYRGADIDTDHCLVLGKVKLKWKKTRRGVKCINVKMLKEEETHQRYSTGLAQCYGQRNRLADVKG